MTDKTLLTFSIACCCASAHPAVDSSCVDIDVIDLQELAQWYYVSAAPLRHHHVGPTNAPDPSTSLGIDRSVTMNEKGGILLLQLLTNSF